jgi:hypothetical protein
LKTSKCCSVESCHQLDAALAALKPRQPSADERLAWRLVEIAVLAEGPRGELLEEAHRQAKSEWLKQHLEVVRGGAAPIAP